MEWGGFFPFEVEEEEIGTIEILVDSENQRWFGEQSVGKFIGMFSIVDQTRSIPYRDRKPRTDLVPKSSIPVCWPEIHRDMFLSMNGLLAVTVHSRKPNARRVMAWLIRTVLPNAFEAVTTKYRDKLVKHETELLANGVNLAYQRQRVDELSKEIRSLRTELQTLRLKTMAEVIKSWRGIVDKSLSQKKEEVKDPYECCPANLQRKIAVATRVGKDIPSACAAEPKEKTETI